MKNRFGLTTQVLIIISLLLLAANFLLGLLTMNQSRNAMKTLIQQRMLDISNSAAAMLDGDVLESLTADDVGTDDYQNIMNTLKVFQENIDLEYIYCITQNKDGSFAFSVDPTPDDPGEFGEPIVYTDALYQASLGTASVDNEPYSDRWGSFYSSYSPVFDSKGNVAGIVAVDFSADWFDKQIRSIVITILLCSVVSLGIGAMIVIVVTARVRNKLDQLDEELNSLTQEVDQLNKEFSLTPDVNEDDDNPFASFDNITNIGSRIRATREGLSLYINHLHTREHSMIAALASEYLAVYYVNLDTDMGVCYRSKTDIKGAVKEGEEFCFSERFGDYCEYVDDEYKEEFMRFISPENIRKSLEAETVISCQYLAVREGRESYEKLRMTAIRNFDEEEIDDGRVHAIGIGFSDVDKETREAMVRNRALSEALAEADESNKAKTAFLSNMSHEIRTPMNAIIGLDIVALSDPGISEKTREYLEKIGVSAKHLLNIINDILDVSRIESGNITLKKEEFYFLSVLEQVNTIISDQCKNKNIEYHCHLSGGIDDYYIGDDVKLRQILINILGNSVKFTNEGGAVELSVERIARYEGNSTMRFVIKDNGIGMDKEFIPRIFDAFSQEDSSITNRYGSTGLGMAITKRIVEMMNGNIEVESEKGKGTTFYVTLTLLDVDSSLIDFDTNELRHQDLRVLIVDNDASACEQARLLMENIGIVSETTLSGESAIERARLHHARSEPYNLILISRDMTDMTDVEIIGKIRSAVGGNSVVILLTSKDIDGIQTEVEKADADGYVLKPLHSANLLEEIKCALKKRSDSAGQHAHKADLSGRKILLAEDTDINAEIMTMILGIREMTVDVAQNGKIAVDMFSSHPVGYYDAILMDIRMPEMDGLTATSVIRAMERPDAEAIPIIALTANAFDEDVQRSLQVGLNAHLSKPIDPDKLYATLEDLIKD